MRRRIFTVAEANDLLPHLREVVRRVQSLWKQVADATDRLKILEVIWGVKVEEPHNPDHHEFRAYQRTIGTSVQEMERLIREEILARGVRFPQGGLEEGLLDFPTLLDGRLVYLCWRLGEPEILAWHEVHEGFRGRRPLTPEVASRMGLASPLDEQDGTGPNPSGQG